MDPTKLIYALICAELTNGSMGGVTPAVLDPSLKDPSIAARLTMQMELFIAWWSWLVPKMKSVGTPGQLPPPEAANLAALLPSGTSDVIGDVLSKLAAGSSPVAAVVSPVLEALAATKK